MAWPNIESEVLLPVFICNFYNKEELVTSAKLSDGGDHRDNNSETINQPLCHISLDEVGHLWGVYMIMYNPGNFHIYG